jgi:hypothetical protein
MCRLFMTLCILPFTGQMNKYELLVPNRHDLMGTIEEITVGRKDRATASVRKFSNPAYIAEAAVSVIKHMTEFEGRSQGYVANRAHDL